MPISPLAAQPPALSELSYTLLGRGVVCSAGRVLYIQVTTVYEEYLHTSSH